MTITKIALASTNQGKIKEFQEIFAPLAIEVIPQQELMVGEIDEPFNTFIENSLHKARHCAKITGLPTLADDSGLCVNGLAGAPGVFSARYAGSPKSDQNNINKLLQEMQDVSDRSAYFYCLLTLLRSADDPQPIFADGVFAGEIAHHAQGSNGHGYDPIFYLSEYQATVAQLDAQLKNKISHRGLAIQNLLEQLKRFNMLSNVP
ncbi:MAG: non-canonical purine pyrophosphatase, RdgB/HAM1 family [Pseudomonadota bacterium]|jgi:XTP/dITP diphosphohydrolase